MESILEDSCFDLNLQLNFFVKDIGHHLSDKRFKGALKGRKDQEVKQSVWRIFTFPMHGPLLLRLYQKIACNIGVGSDLDL